MARSISPFSFWTNCNACASLEVAMVDALGTSCNLTCALSIHILTSVNKAFRHLDQIRLNV
eukprot:1398321-Pyramimonas_sp.AAC.1